MQGEGHYEKDIFFNRIRIDHGIDTHALELCICIKTHGQ